MNASDPEMSLKQLDELLSHELERLMESPEIRIPEQFRHEARIFQKHGVLWAETLEQDRKLYSRFFQEHPPVYLSELRHQAETRKQLDPVMVDQHLRFYLKQKKQDTYQNHLLYLANLCLRLARNVRNSQQQINWVFRSVDFLRMYQQCDHKAIDIKVSALIVHIFSVFPEKYSEKFDNEQKIHQELRYLYHRQQRLSHTGATQNDQPVARFRLGQHYLKQKCFYDAFVHFSFVLDYLEQRPQAYSRGIFSKMRTHSALGHLFQEMIHFTQPGNATLLKHFVDRYNRDFSNEGEWAITPFKRNDVVAMRKTKEDLVRMANHHFQQIEGTGQHMKNGGILITDAVLKFLDDFRYPADVVRAMRQSRKEQFLSKNQFQSVMESSLSQSLSEELVKELWTLLLKDRDNQTSLSYLKLKHHPHWKPLYSDALHQIARNYERMGAGDRALAYAKQACQVLPDSKEKYVLEQKRLLLTYIKQLCHDQELIFRHHTGWKRFKEGTDAFIEITSINEHLQQQTI
ncbi:MAG: hypothetical protein HQM12_09235 [SAR324 cluster bacterium]|nr:hypothetical protein [SAR324 cluster bacterium]